MQKMILESQRKKLRDNYDHNLDRREDTTDFKPVVKLFCPWGAATWLITELDEDDIAYGLCDLGQGSPELGYVSLTELREIRGPCGLYIERDIHFTADKTLAQYAEEARGEGRIAA